MHSIIATHKHFICYFVWGNINIYLHFMSLLHIDFTQVLKTLQVREWPTYSIWSISWLLMFWRRKERICSNWTYQLIATSFISMCMYWQENTTWHTLNRRLRLAWSRPYWINWTNQSPHMHRVWKKISNQIFLINSRMWHRFGCINLLCFID